MVEGRERKGRQDERTEGVVMEGGRGGEGAREAWGGGMQRERRGGGWGE